MAVIVSMAIRMTGDPNDTDASAVGPHTGELHKLDVRAIPFPEDCATLDWRMLHQYSTNSKTEYGRMGIFPARAHWVSCSCPCGRSQAEDVEAGGGWHHVLLGGPAATGICGGRRAVYAWLAVPVHYGVGPLLRRLGSFWVGRRRGRAGTCRWHPTGLPWRHQASILGQCCASRRRPALRTKGKNGIWGRWSASATVD